MALKRLISLIFLLLCMTCVTAQAQLVFEPDEWDFGTVREADGRVSHTFTGVNRGDKPLVILDVVTTCGCTVPEFSRKPIVAGGKTQITVTFDPANRPGMFVKELGVYSSERRKIATLTVRGSVTPRERSVEELYPAVAGGGLRLSSTLCAFSYVYQGRHTHGSVDYANTSGRTLSLELRPVRTSGMLETACAQRIAPGERGEIGFTYHIPADNPRYGTLNDTFEVVVDGKSTGTLLMAHGIAVDNPATAGKKRPEAQLSENILKFGAVKRKGPVVRQRFTLSNTGAGELIVRAVEHDGRIASTLAPGQRIAPGGALQIEVTLDPAKQDYGVMTDRLILITNDPERPMRRLRVTAVIEQ